MHCFNKVAVRPTSPMTATMLDGFAGKLLAYKVVSGTVVLMGGLLLSGLLVYALLGSSSVWADSRLTNFSSRVTQPQRRIIGQSGAYHYGDSRDDARDRDWSDRNTSRTERQRNSRNERYQNNRNYDHRNYYHNQNGSSNQLSARFEYHAPSTTIINRSVQVLPPQAAAGNQVGDVYYNQDTYLIYPPSSPYRPNGYARGYHQPIIPAYSDPKATESRAKQWTDKSDFGGQ